MRHLDTFSGIGGWALAARWMEWETVAFVEKEPFCQQVLKKNFPTVEIHDDIFSFSGKPFRGIDILTGSTPCQPFSQAGKRQGSNDERHLFPEFLRVVGETKPRWIVIENVYGLLNIESGQVFEAYNTSLESEGYSVQTICIPASALGAPHRRDRLWIIAHTASDGYSFRYQEAGRAEQCSQSRGMFQSQRTDSLDGFCITCGQDWDGCECVLPGPFTNTRCEYGQSGRDGGLAANPPEWSYGVSDVERCGEDVANPQNKNEGLSGGAAPPDTRYGSRNWDANWIEVAAEFCGVDDGLPVKLDGFKLSKNKHREGRLKALGNAIVPQIAYEIFQSIAEYELKNQTTSTMG